MAAAAWDGEVIVSAIGAILPYNAAIAAMGAEKISKIRKVFSITVAMFGGRMATMSCSKIGGVHAAGGPMLIFPRFAAQMLLDAKIARRITCRLRGGAAPGVALGGGAALTLTANQQIVLDHLMAKIYTPERAAAGAASAVIHMAAGYGKTYLACGAIAALGRRTMVIVPNKYLLRQWCGVLAAVFPAARVAVHCGAKFGETKTRGTAVADIVVSVVNSAAAYDYAADGSIGFVIYDEVHMYCTRKVSEVFRVAQARFGLGLTATPNERLDGFDPVARWWVGPLIDAATLPGWNANAIHFNAAVTRVVYDGPAECTEMLVSAAGTVSVPLMLNQLIADPWRNAMIVRYAIELYDRGHNVFVFSDRRGHLVALAAAIAAARPGVEDAIVVADECEDDYDELAIAAAAAEEAERGEEEASVAERGPGGEEEAAAAPIAAGVLMGGAADADIVRVSAGRIILTTYQYSGTGVSIEKMDALILATPRRSKLTQILGRIFRLGGDAAVRREVIDIVDNRTTLKSQYSSRKKIYAAAGYADTIVTVKRSWRDYAPPEAR